MKKNYFTLPLLAVAILFISCSKDASNELTQKVLQVSMKGSSFTPENSRIRSGTAVTWMNDDTVVHRIIEQNRAFDSGDLRPGQTYHVNFAEPGNYNYRCLHHPDGIASVLVTER